MNITEDSQAMAVPISSHWNGENKVIETMNSAGTSYFIRHFAHKPRMTLITHTGVHDSSATIWHILVLTPHGRSSRGEVTQPKNRLLVVFDVTLYLRPSHFHSLFSSMLATAS